jgi:hypothetical protein
VSVPQIPTPARLLVSIIFSEAGSGSRGDFIKNVIEALTRQFGQADYVSEINLFTQTKYYDQEMGDGLQRVFVSFEKLVPREHLAGIKLLTNSLEKKFARSDGTRCCNLDPGLLTVENFILATGKNFTHRIYLKDGIFSEVTLLFQKGKFRALPWTYWDYAAEPVVEMLTTMRKTLIEELKSLELL